MLRNLSREDWLTWLNVPPHRIPRVLLLRGTRNLKLNYAKYSAHFTNVVEVGSPNSIFEDVLIGDYEGMSVGYASVYGNVMAAEITHVFGVWGARLVIQTGSCGGLGEHVMPGDLVCAIAAHCGEGASSYYAPGVDKVDASQELVASIPDSVESVPVHKGPVFTTSTLLAEGFALVREWCDQGFIAVDMETASTFAVARHFGMRRVSLLYAFDNPCRGDHALRSDSDKSDRREAGERAMIEAAFSLVRSC